MKTHRAFLVVDARGNMRVVKTAPHLDLGQVAFRLIVNIPDSWAKVVGEIKLDLAGATRAWRYSWSSPSDSLFFLPKNEVTSP